MPVKPATHKPACTTAKRHMVSSDNESKTRKDFTNASGYGYKWRKESKAYLKANPLCVECEASGAVRLSTDVDHIKKHEGDMDLFWRRSNWQSLCSYHHKAKTGRGE